MMCSHWTTTTHCVHSRPLPSGFLALTASWHVNEMSKPRGSSLQGLQGRDASLAPVPGHEEQQPAPLGVIPEGLSVYVYLHMCMHAHICICACIYTYVCVYTHTHPTSLGLTDLVRNHRLSWVRDCSEGREVLAQSTSVTPEFFALQI